MINRLRPFSTILCLIVMMTAPTEGRVLVRMGTMAPDGSAWHKILERMGANWKAETDGDVTLRIFAGGVAGDEGTLIRKMRIGQLQAAALSNTALAEIDRSAYSIMLPLMFESYEEWDYVRAVINQELEARLEQKGFIVLAWSDAGWVYFFSKKPVTTPGQLQDLRLAASASDTVAVDILKWAGFRPIPITTIDTIPGLQTGLVEAVPLPTILANISQFYRYAKNMTDLKWVPLQGAILMHRRAWSRLSEPQRRAVKKAAKEAGDQLKQEIRRQEEAALRAMVRRGLKVWEVDEASLREWHRAAQAAYPRIRGTLVSPELFDKVQRLRNEFRSRR
ncbi:MAG: TRAP transporter substrate-binding protein DctP [Acidobacteriota bacterium]|nr:TRAP transporter substrate-binding protein DctP [Acidobacteriota bacterium]